MLVDCWPSRLTVIQGCNKRECCPHFLLLPCRLQAAPPSPVFPTLLYLSSDFSPKHISGLLIDSCSHAFNVPVSWTLLFAALPSLISLPSLAHLPSVKSTQLNPSLYFPPAPHRILSVVFLSYLLFSLSPQSLFHVFPFFCHSAVSMRQLEAVLWSTP